MKIAKIEDLHCNAGWRDFSFLKITTDDGVPGDVEEIAGQKRRARRRYWTVARGEQGSSRERRLRRLLAASTVSSRNQRDKSAAENLGARRCADDGGFSEGGHEAG